MDLRESMWDSFAKICVYNLPRNFSASKLPWYTVACMLLYGTAQFKLDRTRVWHGLDMTHFFILQAAIMRVHARLMTSNLLCKAIVYALEYTCMSGAHTPSLVIKAIY